MGGPSHEIADRMLEKACSLEEDAEDFENIYKQRGDAACWCRVWACALRARAAKCFKAAEGIERLAVRNAKL